MQAYTATIMALYGDKSEELEQHMQLRMAARQHLNNVGERTNPGYSDNDIMKRLCEAHGGLEHIAFSEGTHGALRGQLIGLLAAYGIESALSISTTQISSALDQLPVTTME